MPILWMIISAFAVQIVTSLVFDVLIDAIVIGILFVWIRTPQLIPRWLRGRKGE